MRSAAAAGIFFTATALFPGADAHPSCDVNTLAAGDFATVDEIKKSGAGNQGGVYFMSMTQAGEACSLVIKPKLDIHDIFASELGKRLDVPVATVKPHKPTDDIWAPMLAAFERHELKAKFEETNGGSYALFMGLAAGKDTATWTFEKHGSAQCHKCNQEILTKDLKNLCPDLTEDDAGDDKFAECMAGVLNKEKLGGLKPICKVLWNKFLDNDANLEAAKGYVTKLDYTDMSNENAKAAIRKAIKDCSLNWRKAQTKDTIKPMYVADKQRIQKEILDRLYMKNGLAAIRSIESGPTSYCPAESIPAEEDMNQAKAEFNAMVTNAGTRAALGKLGLFEEIIGEGDGTPKMNSAGSNNFHNFFIGSDGATGIDMAVGGAKFHEEISADCDPTNVAGNDPSMLEAATFRDTFKAALCGSAEDKTEVTKGWNKIQRPWDNDNDMERASGAGSWNKCAREPAGLLLTAEVRDATTHAILNSYATSFPAIAAAFDNAVGETKTQLDALSPDERPIIANIAAYLRYRFSVIKSGHTEAVAACPAMDFKASKAHLRHNKA